MEAAIALAVFIGLPVAVLLLVARLRRPRRTPASVQQRLSEVEQVVVHQDARLNEIERHLAALEQAQTPLYRVQ